MTSERDRIISENSIQQELEKRGLVAKKKGVELVYLCPLHKEDSPSFSVNPEKNTFHCFGCQQGGSIIDLVSKLDGLSIGEAIRKLAGTEVCQKPIKINEKPVAEYNYTNEAGKLVYQVVRYLPKTFKQRSWDGDRWTWKMDGVARVLYNLPQVTKANTVWIVEGEKDADNLKKLGFIATCNVGGAGKWMDGYTASLKGKDIVICGDNDKAGKSHVEQVLEALAGRVKTIKLIKLPESFKDVSDFIEATEDAGNALAAMAEESTAITHSLNIPIYSMEELEAHYREFVKTVQTQTVNLGAWLPTLGRKVRGLVPGELVTILADTGVGKTAIIQNIAHNIILPTLIFEIELPGSLMFERFMSIDQKMDGATVEKTYLSGGQLDWKSNKKLNHIFSCTLSKLDTAKIEELILKAELKMGVKPVMVMIDYIGLLSDKGSSRYERMSAIAEQLKIIAKSTGTIIVIVSQIHRPTGETGEVYLHDAKDSGSIENSSGLVLGAWKTSQCEMSIKILKNTKGSGGDIIPCVFKGETLTISEQRIIIEPQKRNGWGDQ